LTIGFGPLGVPTRNTMRPHGKEFSSVTDEFLLPCRSHLRAVGMCEPPT